MRPLSFRFKKAARVASGLLFATRLALAPSHSRAADDPASGKQPPLRISLFPYVPDQGLIKQVVEKRWLALHPDVWLKFVDGDSFDSYKQDPPDDLDVFEFDGIGLEYFARNNWVTPLAQDEVNEPEDILDFAWKGSMVDGRIYAIPRLACTYVLIYRKRDKEVAEAALGVEGKTATGIFGSPDDMKLKSCATLFTCVSPEGSVFHRLLDKYFQADRDEKTLQLVSHDSGAR
jgi:thiamine pyridinylase